MRRWTPHYYNSKYFWAQNGKRSSKGLCGSWIEAVRCVN